MRKTIYLCDECGLQHEEAPIKINPEEKAFFGVPNVNCIMKTPNLRNEKEVVLIPHDGLIFCDVRCALAYFKRKITGEPKSTKIGEVIECA